MYPSRLADFLLRFFFLSRELQSVMKKEKWEASSTFQGLWAISKTNLVFRDF